MVRSFIFVVAISFLSTQAFSQCCSPGNPIGGSTNQGVLRKNILRTITFYSFSFSDDYYSGSKKQDYDFVEDAYYNFAGTNLAYGLTNKITLETELGYFINKVQEYNIPPPNINKGFGLSNGVVSIKTPLIKKEEKEFEFTGGLGLKFPFTITPQIVDNVQLPRDVQSSTGAFSIVGQTFLYKGFLDKGLRFFFINRYEYNFSNPVTNYRYGNPLYSSFFIAKSLGLHWIFIAQIRNEWRIQDISLASNKKIIQSTGGNIVFFSPQIFYSIGRRWNISILADIPLYKYYIGSQLSTKYAVTLTLMRDFDLSKKIITAQ